MNIYYLTKTLNLMVYKITGSFSPTEFAKIELTVILNPNGNI